MAHYPTAPIKASGLAICLGPIGDELPGAEVVVHAVEQRGPSHTVLKRNDSRTNSHRTFDKCLNYKSRHRDGNSIKSFQ